MKLLRQFTITRFQFNGTNDTVSTRVHSKSPTQKLRFFCVHLLRRFKDGKYSFLHLFQKTSAAACTDLHFLVIVNLLLMEYSCDCVFVTADYKVTWSECFLSR